MVRNIETESRMVVTRGCGAGKEAESFNGYRVSVLHDERILEISCATMGIYLALLNCEPKMI